MIAAGAAVAGLDDLRGRVAAINDPDFHSGSNALRALVAPLARDGRFFGAVKVSGSHALSLAKHRAGGGRRRGDRLHHPRAARAPPAGRARRYAGAVPDRRRPRAAVRDQRGRRSRAGRAPARSVACGNRDPALAGARADLLLDGIEVLPRTAYGRIRAFARFAAAMAAIRSAPDGWRALGTSARLKCF